MKINFIGAVVLLTHGLLLVPNSNHVYNFHHVYICHCLAVIDT